MAFLKAEGTTLGFEAQQAQKAQQPAESQPVAFFPGLSNYPPPIDLQLERRVGGVSVSSLCPTSILFWQPEPYLTAPFPPRSLSKTLGIAPGAPKKLVGIIFLIPLLNS